MATEQNQLPTPKDQAPDSGTADDGGGNLPVVDTPAPAASAAPAAEPPAEPAKPTEWRDTAREQIFARAKEKRAAETVEFSGDITDPAVLYGSNTDQDDMGELEKEALRRRQAAAQPAADQEPQPAARTLNDLPPEVLAQKFITKVDGRDIEVTAEDLIRNFQKNSAADQRLATAQQILRQAQEFQRSHQDAGLPENPGQDDRQDAGDTRPHARDTSAHDVDVTALAEKIQLGSHEEVIDALETFIATAQQRHVPVDDSLRVLTVLEDQNAKQTIARFAEANPLIADPVVQSTATRMIHREMALDLLAAGYSNDDLRAQADTPEKLTHLHKMARINKVRNVRNVEQITAAGYHGALNHLRGIVGQASAGAPHQVATMQQRQERKDSLQVQPAARRLTPTPPQAQQPRTQDQSRANAVARMRQARGQAV